ncbi:MAG TPA: FprA family A-type flavoprotein, partial [Dehalococcoidia bacterium]|nr:FprA family A-type flavoprotein [Dehalococcoidia bacterium]
MDWTLRDFHGYSTPHGTTYNAYLVLDEKKALIDTVRSSHFPELVARVKEVLDPREIDYVVSLHVEPDHSGSLSQVLALCPKAQVVTVERHGEQGLERYFHQKLPLITVKEGSTLSLGKRSLSFTPIPLVHWPDNMMAFLSPGAILFSSDCYGQHLATSARFDDQVDTGMLMAEAAKYYANIIFPYPTQAARALEKTLALMPEVICPSHGVTWRGRLTDILESYGRWTRGETNPRAVVVYDTMWHSTEAMALAMVEGIAQEGVEVCLHSLGSSDPSDIVAELLEARALAVGSPLLNNNLLPRMAAFLTYLKGLRTRGRVGAAFGSFGWGGATAVKAIKEDLTLAGLEVMEE